MPNLLLMCIQPHCMRFLAVQTMLKSCLFHICMRGKNWFESMMSKMNHYNSNKWITFVEFLRRIFTGGILGALLTRNGRTKKRLKQWYSKHKQWMSQHIQPISNLLSNLCECNMWYKNIQSIHTGETSSK